jgi:signal transduction histidine kinase
VYRERGGGKEVFVTETVRTCPACRLAVSPDARFCPNCGSRVDGEPGGPIAYSQPETRLFGVLAPLPTFVLAVVFLVGALVAFVTGSWVLGIMLLAFSAAMFVLFYGAAERDPSSGVSRGALGTVARVAGWTRLAQGSAGAWGSAGRRLFELRREIRPLRAERREVQFALGDAAYRQDETAVAALRARMAEIDDAIAANEREQEEVRARAKRRVEDERFAARETQFLPPDDAESQAEAPR